MQPFPRPWGMMNIRIDGPDTGPTLVLANSLGTDLRLWDALLPLLPPALRVLRFDLRGHGLSDLGTAPCIDDLADDAIAMIEAQAKGPVVMLGLSIGGQIAQSVAARRPDLLAGLVLSNTAAKLGTSETWAARIADIRAHGLEGIVDTVMQRWFTPAFCATPAVAVWRNMMLRCDLQGYIGCCQALAQADFTASTAQITLPTLVLAGDHDGASPPSVVRATADLIAGARFELLQDAGHLPHVEAPVAYASHLNAFLDEVLHV